MLLAIASAISALGPSSGDHPPWVRQSREAGVTLTLTSIKVSANTVTELKTAVQDVQSNLSGLSSAAGSQWGEQIGNFKSALTKLQTSVSALATERNASSVSGVVTAIAAVPIAGRQLLTAASSRCPSASASPTAS
jgi:hypothetical protein